MVAPLWGDVDTRNGGQIYYKLSGSNLIVTWNGVRFYPSSSGLVNTFQAIIGTNADALTGVGQNVSLRYGDMQWTTGDASGGSGGFGGVPATVGINKGNSVNYVQIGRFNQNNSLYDGPGGAYDGVNYLDNQCVSFNVSNANNIPPSITGLPANNTLNLSCGQTVNLSMVAIAPEVNQNVTVTVNMGGMCNATSSVNGGNVNIALTAAQCNSGANTITITATDNGIPVGTTVQTITVNVANCCQLAIGGIASDATCSNAFDGSVNLTPTGASGQTTYLWSNGSTAEDLSGVSQGTYSVTATDAMGCTDNATFTIGFNDNIIPSVVTTAVIVQLDASGNGSTTASAVNNGSSDACGIATMSLSNTSFTCADVGPNTVTLTVTDVNGNSSSATATVTVEDNVLPVAIAQNVTVQLDASGNGVITAADVDNGSSDACGVSSMSLDQTTFDCSDIGTTSTATIVSDGSWTQSTIELQTPSTVVSVQNSLPATSTYTLPVTNVYPYNGTLIFTPNVPGTQPIYSNGGTKFFRNDFVLTGQPSSLRLRARVDNYMELFINGQSVGLESSLSTQNFSNSAYHDILIDQNGVHNGNQGGMTFDQVTSLSILSLLHAGSNEIVFAIGNTNGTDEGGFSVRMDAEAEGIPVTLTVTDNNGNTSTDEAFAIIRDNVAPVVLTQNVLVQLDASGNGSITATDVDNGSSDNCGIASLAIDKTTFSCTDTEVQSSLYFDGSLDKVTVPANSALNFNTGTVEAWVKPGASNTNRAVLAMRTTVWNTRWSIHLNESANSMGLYNGSSYTTFPYNFVPGTWYHVAVSFTGNATVFYINGVQAHSMSTQINTSVTNTPFAVGSPNDPGYLHEDFIGEMDEVRVWNVVRTAAQILSSKDSGLAGTETGLVTYLPFNENTGTTTSDKSSNGFTASISGAAWNTQNSPVSSSPVVILTVTDNNGNVSSATSTVTVLDNLAPVMATNSISVDLVSRNMYVLTQAEIDQLGANSSDNCSVTFTISSHSIDCSTVGQTIGLILTGTDASGNTSSVPVTVLVTDLTSVCNDPPVAVCQNITIYTGANCVASIVANDIDGGSIDPDGDVLSYTVNNSGPFGVGTYSVTMTVSDGEYSDDCVATVTVIDNTLPVVVAQNVTVQLDASGNGSTTAAAVNNGSSDACGVASMTINNASFTCANVGSNNPVTLTVTDVNGNVSTASAMVTVEDNVAPVAVAQNVTVQLDASGNGSTTAVLVNNGSNDACGIATMTINNASFTCANVGANNPVTLTVTDVNGNVSTASVMVTVEDNVNPLAVAQNVTVQLDASGNGSTTATAVNNGSNDACGIATITINNASFTCANVGSNNPVTLTVTDVNGNVSIASAMVTVEDNVNPVAVAQNVTVQLDASGNGSTTATAVNNGSSDACGVASMTINNASFTCANVGSNNPVTLTVTDVNGNVSTASAMVTVEDNVNPVAVAQNVTVQLDASGNGSTTAALVNNGSSDACGVASMTINNASFTCANVGSSNPVTLTVTDVNGNVSTASAMVTVEDNVNPVAVAQNVTVQLDASGNGSTTATAVNNGSSDACGVASMTINNGSFTCANVGSNNPVTLTVTDVNGNVSTASAMVTVEDNVNPVALCQAVTVTLANGTASVTPTMIDNGSNDACGIASLMLSEDTWSCGDIGSHTVTLTVTDNNGNVSSCNAVVTVVGEVPTCSIASMPSNNTYTGGVNTTLYIGYGAQSTTLNCTPTGGSSFTYAWTGSNLSSSSASNPVFTPTTEGIYNFSVLVTNNNGCETTCTISICVRDIRVYKKGKLQKNKVYLCHVPSGNSNNPQTLSVSVNAIASHLSNHSGDALGTCNSSCGSLGTTNKTGEMFSEEFEGQDVDVILYPNPSTDHFSVMVESEMEDMITIEVYDMAGNIVERTEGQFTYHEIEMGRNLASGIYMVVITQGNYRKVLRASITK